MMKMTLILLTLNTMLFANINTIVSILPEQTFVKAIGKEKVNVAVMVQPGNSPHNYEPKPSQMVEISKAELYFAIGVEFEAAWLGKFKSLNPKMQIVDLAEGITKIEMPKAHDDDEHEAHHEGHNHTGSDPHIWTSPANVKHIAQTIYKALAQKDPANAGFYKTNLEAFLLTVEETDTQIKQILSTLGNQRKFMVFHPSWGYFAKAYDLEQIAVEVEGKEPKPKVLMHLLSEAKEERVSAIFTQPEFSDAVSQVIAKELQIPVKKISPLAPNWSENLIGMAKAIAGKE